MIDVNPEQFNFLKMQAEVLAASRFANNMSPPDILYAYFAVGRPRGLNMAQTLQNIHLMRGGKISEHAALQWGDVERSGLLEDVIVEERSAERVSLTVKRKGRSPQTITWSMEDARRAGLANSQTWKQYPARMLEARAKTEAATLVFADVVTGSAGSGANTYSTEEAAFFSGSREDEAKLADVVGVPELAPTEEAPARAPAPAPAPAPDPRPDPISARLLLRIRHEAEEKNIDPDLFFKFLEEREVMPPLLPADVHDICERYLDERSEFDAWAAR
jgi:hypothetical protein